MGFTKRKRNKVDRVIHRDGPVCVQCGRVVIFGCQLKDVPTYRLRRQGGCVFQHRQQSAGWKWVRVLRLGTLDHIVPRSLGGGSGVSNLQVMCWRCNLAKADQFHLFQSHKHCPPLPVTCDALGG